MARLKMWAVCPPFSVEGSLLSKPIRCCCWKGATIKDDKDENRCFTVPGPPCIGVCVCLWLLDSHIST